MHAKRYEVSSPSKAAAQQVADSCAEVEEVSRRIVQPCAIYVCVRVCGLDGQWHSFNMIGVKRVSGQLEKEEDMDKEINSTLKVEA